MFTVFTPMARIIVLTAAILTGADAALADTPPPATEIQEARITALVSSVPMAVDLAAYDLAERAFADEVIIDYTSLWGGAPATMTPAALMTAWQGIVPGFDATWHKLGDVSVTVAGNNATATAFVDGRHWIDGQIWRPVGNYIWDLTLKDGQWKITRMEFAMTEEFGDRALAAEATERARSAN